MTIDPSKFARGGYLPPNTRPVADWRGTVLPLNPARRTTILTPTASEKCLGREHGECKGRAWDLPRLLPTNCKCPCHGGAK